MTTVLGLAAAQSGADAAGCGFLGLSTCAPTPPTGAPGTPVPKLADVSQSSNGGTNAKVGDVASTTVLGSPNAGTVPIAGLASARADDGAFVAYESRLDARTLDLMIYSPALKGAAPVRVLLPAKWSGQSASTWPSLYLLHGGNDKTGYQSWSLYTTLPQESVGLNALIIMPSIGQDAFATNYWNYGLPNQGNQWDTFAALELPQLLQRGYRASTTAAVAGVSSGGYSALALGALHPAVYAAAASYSGLIDTTTASAVTFIQTGQVAEFKSPIAMWGDYLLTNSIWRAHNPADLVANLRNTKLFVSAGNGDTGPFDSPTASAPTLDFIEPTVQGISQSFVQKAQAAGVAVTTDFYGSGTHSWPYWDRELGRSFTSVIGPALGLAGSIGG